MKNFAFHFWAFTPLLPYGRPRGILKVVLQRRWVCQNSLKHYFSAALRNASRRERSKDLKPLTFGEAFEVLCVAEEK